MPVQIHGKIRLECEFKDVTLNLAAKITEEHFPDIWKYTFVKSINPPPNYPSFKAPATAFATAMILTRTTGAIQNMTMAVPVLEKHDWPTYYVADKLLTALQHTNPPMKTWKDLTLPFPGMIFMLPDKAISEPGTENYLRFVGFANVGNSKSYMLAGSRIPITGWPTSEERIVLFWSVNNCLVIQDCTFPISQPLTPSVDWIDQQTEVHDRLRRQSNSYQESIPAPFSSYLAGLVANFILTMTARPEWVEKSAPINSKPLKSGVFMFNPTFIGRKYQIKYDKRPTPTGAHFTELRWRAGHWRTQHHGPGGQHEKEILIEPYLAHSAGLVRPASNAAAEGL